MRNLSTAASFLVLLPWLLLALGTLAAPTAPNPAVVAEAERTFAKTGLERGIRASFLEYLADDSILFAPGPRNAKKYYTDYKDQGLALIWQPSFATISCSGDLGVTTGPWHIKKSRSESEQIAYGEFVSVWKLQPDKSWKVVFDTGIDHAAPASSSIELELLPPKIAQIADRRDKERALVESFKEFNDGLAQKGPQVLIDYADDRIRILRDDVFPIVGKEKANDILPTHAITITRQLMGPNTSGLSLSSLGDLAYGYGAYAEQHETGLTENGHFVSVWRIDANGKWKAIIDLQKKVPVPEKNKRTSI
jgi:ketosteroid isomerase-like protein